MSAHALEPALDALLSPALGMAFPACALSVWHQGVEVFRGAWGEVGGRAARDDDLYDLASVSKLYTTTAALRAIARGRLGLDEPLVRWVGEFAGQGPRGVGAGCDPHTLAPLPIHPRWAGHEVDPQRVTLRQLLTHTAGVQAWLPLFQALGPAPPPPSPGEGLDTFRRHDEALRRICLSAFAHPPEVEPLYSDLGLILLGEAVARADGAALSETLNREVLQPLGARRCGFNPVGWGWAGMKETVPTEFDARWRHRRVRGEVHDENACAMGGVAGHAGLFASVAEVGAFGQAWLQAGALWDLPPDLAAQATRAHHVYATRRRGLGFMLRATVGASCGERFSADSFGHTGYTGTSLWIDPRARLVVAFLSNAVHGGRDMSALYALRPTLHDLIAYTLMP